jgi:linear primary-alkylsulfatase
MRGRPFALALATLAAASFLAGCGKRAEPAAAEVTPTTLNAQAEAAKAFDLGDPRDFDNAQRGLVARPTGRVVGVDGRVLVDFEAFRFVEGPAPPTVNPSLWRQAKLNAQVGLFKVADGIHQLRGFDLANMTLIEGKTGWIVIDTLTSAETAAAALAFARQHLGDRPVSAIVFTHSHIDHFGGAHGVLTPQQASERSVPVVAPEGFIEESTSENVLVGIAMGRRSAYQFGKDLERSAGGLVDNGIGKELAYGRFGILPPTLLITKARQEVTLDGVHFVFHNVPGAEAPAELVFTIPELKAMGGAEILSQTIHNLLPVRGAQVRDALRWASYLQQTLDEMGDSEVYFGQHNWPVWGREQIVGFLTRQRDIYKYTHDQTVRLINAGLTPGEIAETIQLPKSLREHPAVRGYYGDLRHNVKAVYQFYMGAYDGNPAHLNPLPPQESAKRYVALIGGADKCVAAAQSAFDKGDYRWAAELLNHVVFADSGHAAAKALLARSYEQMGYMSEASTWRNSYLSAARELRLGPPKTGIDRSGAIELLAQTPVERFLEALAAGLDGQAAEGKQWKINLVLSDTKQSFVLWIENAVLHFKASSPATDANATLTLTRPILIKTLAGTAGVRDTLLSDDLQVDGSALDLVRFFSLFDKASGTFPIVTR